jgi:hypothetical protein
MPYMCLLPKVVGLFIVCTIRGWRAILQLFAQQRACKDLFKDCWQRTRIQADVTRSNRQLHQTLDVISSSYSQERSWHTSRHRHTLAFNIVASSARDATKIAKQFTRCNSQCLVRNVHRRVQIRARAQRERERERERERLCVGHTISIDISRAIASGLTL